MEGEGGGGRNDHALKGNLGEGEKVTQENVYLGKSTLWSGTDV